MFCMHCGQQLPEGAKFCKYCGTPQGSVSPTGITRTEMINLDGTHTFVPAMCPNCNAHMKVDTSSKVARCDSCGTECLVQDAIKTLTIYVSSTNTDSLLQRVEIMLGDGDFDGAMSKCDTILDFNPTNGKVYYYMLLANLKCKNKSDLANQPSAFDNNQYYIKAIQYGDDNLKSELLGYTSVLSTRDKAKLKDPKIGDEIYFGTINGQKILWKVLKIQERMALIISNECIIYLPYDKQYGNIAWNNCTLRAWLNNDFLNGSFTQAERTQIQPYELNNTSRQGNIPTTDMVFLLSEWEARGLFSDEKAMANGSRWWLRSNGGLAATNSDGKVVYPGNPACLNNNGVRPAMWIKFED